MKLSFSISRLIVFALVASCQPLDPQQPIGVSESALTQSAVQIENVANVASLHEDAPGEYGRLEYMTGERPGLWLRNQAMSGHAPAWGQVFANADIHNVRDFGADPTGVFDSAAAIQAAVDQARAGGRRGGIVYFPPGEYHVHSPVVLPRDPFPWNPFAPISLIGAGRGASFVLGVS